MKREESIDKIVFSIAAYSEDSDAKRENGRQKKSSEKSAHEFGYSAAMQDRKISVRSVSRSISNKFFS